MEAHDVFEEVYVGRNLPSNSLATAPHGLSTLVRSCLPAAATSASHDLYGAGDEGAHDHHTRGEHATVGDAGEPPLERALAPLKGLGRRLGSRCHRIQPPRENTSIAAKSDRYLPYIMYL